MTNKFKQWNLSIGRYRTSLISILLLSSLPGLIVGFVLFFVVNHKVEYELQHNHQTQLHRAAETIADQFSTAEMFIAHWSFDPKFNENLKNLDFRLNYKEIHDIYRTLLVMEGSNPLFELVELYINEPNPVVFTKDGYKLLQQNEQILGYNELLAHSKSLFWNNSSQRVRLVHKIPAALAGQYEPYGALIIYMNHAKISNLVQTLTPYNQGSTIVFDDQGRFLFTPNGSDQQKELNEAIYQEVSALQSREGTFLFNWDNKSYSVTYGEFNLLGSTWYFFSAALLSSITGPVIFISKIIIGTSLLVLLLAGGWAWIASRRLYSPIQKLVQKVNIQEDEAAKVNIKNEFELIESRWNHLSRESQILQTKLEQNLPHLRKGFLMQLLQGYMHPFKDDELRERMINLGWEIKNQRFIIVLVQLLGFSKLEGRFSDGDEGLVSFTAANIMEELMAGSMLQADVINFHDLSIGILILVPAHMQRKQLDEELYQISEKTIFYIENILKMRSTVSISHMTDSIKKIAAIYEDAKLALRFRNLQESSQIIDLEKLEEENRGFDSSDFHYPFEIENEITYALRLGDEEKALRAIREFVHLLHHENRNEVELKQGVLQLLGSILQVVLQSGFNSNQLYEGVDLYEKLGEKREPEEIVRWFEQDIVRPFIIGWAERKDQHMRQYVEKTIILLNDNYMKDISLEYCADQIHISPYTLSRGFKQITGLNFVDYLMNIRLEKAKQLLRDTDMKISEVAENVGYQHSYFNRLFKKHESITPSQYREKARRNG